MRKIITLLLILLSFVSHAQTNYYVDGANGNNANNGLTLATAWKTLQKACNSAVANSVVHIKSGTYYENIAVNSSGTAGNPIRFTNYLGGTVIIDGTGTTGSVLLSISNKSYLTFENMILQNLTSAYAKGINLDSGAGTCAGITFRNITIRNINWTNNAAQIPVESDNAWGLKVKGQLGGVTNLTIDGCQIHDNVLGFSEALTLSGNVDGFTIKNCLVYDNTNIGIDIIGNNGSSIDPTIDIPRNGLISGNTCYGNMSPIALSAGIYVDGAHNVIIERNSCYENEIGIEVGCEENGEAKYIEVKNNLIYSNKNTGLAVGGYTTETTGQVLYSTFRNNTFFQNNTLNAGIGEITITKASGCVFEDNLVFSNTQNVLMALLDIAPQENNIINYNCWFTPSGNQNNILIYEGLATYHTFASYKIGSAFDSNSLYANPGLIISLLPSQEGLFLIESSNCINSGNPELTISEGETDFDGNPRISGSTVDMGAREFTTTLAAAYPEFNIAAAYAAPNPFHNQTQIYSPVALSGATFRMYDAYGKKVREIDNISGESFPVEQSGLAIGIYMFEITQDNNIRHLGKLIVE
jgi:parallel beta-helix repeat protein